MKRILSGAWAELTGLTTQDIYVINKNNTIFFFAELSLLLSAFQNHRDITCQFSWQKSKHTHTSTLIHVRCNNVDMCLQRCYFDIITYSVVSVLLLFLSLLLRTRTSKHSRMKKWVNVYQTSYTTDIRAIRGHTAVLSKNFTLVSNGIY